MKDQVKDVHSDVVKKISGIFIQCVKKNGFSVCLYRDFCFKYTNTHDLIILPVFGTGTGTGTETWMNGLYGFM